MDNSKRGIWKLSMFIDGEWLRLGPDGEVHNIEATDDCEGDVLFDYMTEHGLIDSWDQYETDGDREHVAIMRKHLTRNGGDGPDYAWEFQEFAPPSPASDDCHTF